MNVWLATISLTAVLLAAPVLAADPPAASVRIAPDRVDFLAGSEVVGSYHVGKSVAKPYLWPLLAPGGIPVTRAWPMEKGQPGELTDDHVHQKSAWFCHGDVIPEGVSLPLKPRGVDGADFWAEAKGLHGVIRCTGVDRAGMAAAITKNQWTAPNDHIVLDESRKVSLHLLPEGQLFVFDIDLAANGGPVTFGDTKEGSFGVRVNDQLLVKARVRGKDVGNPKSVIRNADGQTGEKGCWGQVSVWCDYSGVVDGKAVGVAVFAHPSNKHPTAWHVRDYGLLAANPFGRARAGFPAMKGRNDLVKLAQGEHLKMRYAIYAHTGDAEAGKVADAFTAFTRLKD